MTDDTALRRMLDRGPGGQRRPSAARCRVGRMMAAMSCRQRMVRIGQGRPAKLPAPRSPAGGPSMRGPPTHWLPLDRRPAGLLRASAAHRREVGVGPKRGWGGRFSGHFGSETAYEPTFGLKTRIQKVSNVRCKREKRRGQARCGPQTHNSGSNYGG